MKTFQRTYEVAENVFLPITKYQKVVVKETKEKFLLPVIETETNYKWQYDCLIDRLEHPEKYQNTENVQESIEHLKHWLSTHKERG